MGVRCNGGACWGCSRRGAGGGGRRAGVGRGQRRRQPRRQPGSRPSSTALALEEETATTGLGQTPAALGYFGAGPRSHTRIQTISLSCQAQISRWDSSVHHGGRGGARTGPWRPTGSGHPASGMSRSRGRGPRHPQRHPQRPVATTASPAPARLVRGVRGRGGVGSGAPACACTRSGHWDFAITPF